MIPNDRAFNGNPSFEFDGKTFFRYHKLAQQGEYQFKINLVAKNSPYKQGIAVSFSTKPKFKGTLLINGVEFSPRNKHSIHVIGEELFNDNDLELKITIEEGFVSFSNASDILGDYREELSKFKGTSNKTLEHREYFTSGFTAANLYGNAFWIENVSENKKRVHCNDHKMDDDFDDLILDIEVKD